MVMVVVVVAGGWDASCSKLESVFAGDHLLTDSVQALPRQKFNTHLFFPHILLLRTQKERIDLTITDEGPMAHAFVIISAAAAD